MIYIFKLLTITERNGEIIQRSEQNKDENKRNEKVALLPIAHFNRFFLNDGIFFFYMYGISNEELVKVKAGREKCYLILLVD